MLKKNKITNTDPSINLRLSQELKDQLIIGAQNKNETVSKYVRNLLSDYFSGALFEEEVFSYEKVSFLNSEEFNTLIVWIYRKDRLGYEKGDEKLFIPLKSTLKKIDNYVSVKIAREFEKVLFGIMKCESASQYLKMYTFIKSIESKERFNFEIVEEFLINPSDIILV